MTVSNAVQQLANKIEVMNKFFTESHLGYILPGLYHLARRLHSLAVDGHDKSALLCEAAISAMESVITPMVIVACSSCRRVAEADASSMDLTHMSSDEDGVQVGPATAG